MRLKLLLAILILFNLTGCATTKNTSAKAQVQQLQSQVGEMEMQLKQRDEEIQGLEKELEKAENVKAAQSKTPAVNTGKPSPKQLQAALKNAGFYDGAIDGKIGKNSKKAIMAFQEANGLIADGVAGSKTWSKLKRYLQ